MDSGVSSIEPNDSDNQMDGAQEVARGFVAAARGNDAVLFEPGKGVLDQVVRLVRMAVQWLRW